jgi:trigger factor
MPHAMQSSLETLSNLERRINVSVPAEQIEKEITKRLKELEPKIEIPGFRKGKVPANIVKQRFENRVRDDVMGDIIRETYLASLKQEKLEPATWPKIDVTSKHEPNTELSYTATFEVFPEVKLADLSQIIMEKDIGEISDADLEWMLQTLRKQRAKWIEITDQNIAAQAGHKVAIDFDITIESDPPETITNETTEFELGAQQMWQEFEEKIYGHKLNDEFSFSLTFPESHLQRQFAGKKVNYKVKLKKMWHAELPEINDEFAKAMGFEEGGVEALRENVKRFMETQLAQNLEQKNNKLVLEKLYELNPIEIPRSLIESEVRKRIATAEENLKHQLGMKNTPELNREFFTDQVKKDLALGLILSNVIKTQKLEVNPQKMREHLQAMIERGNHKQVAELSQNKEQMDNLRVALLEEEALDYLKQQINFTEKKINYREIFDKKVNTSIQDKDNLLVEE